MRAPKWTDGEVEIARECMNTALADRRLRNRPPTLTWEDPRTLDSTREEWCLMVRTVSNALLDRIKARLADPKVRRT